MLVMAGLVLTLFLMKQIPIRPPVTWFWVPSYQGDQLVLVLKGEVHILGISVTAGQTGKVGHLVTTGYSHQDLSVPVKVSLIKVCLDRHATWGHLIKNCLVCQETCLGTCLTYSLITACLLPDHCLVLLLLYPWSSGSGSFSSILGPLIVSLISSLTYPYTCARYCLPVTDGTALVLTCLPGAELTFP